MNNHVRDTTLSHISSNDGALGMSSNPQNIGDRQRIVSVLQSQRGANPANALALDVWSPVLWDYTDTP